MVNNGKLATPAIVALVLLALLPVALIGFYILSRRNHGFAASKGDDSMMETGTRGAMGHGHISHKLASHTQQGYGHGP